MRDAACTPDLPDDERTGPGDTVPTVRRRICAYCHRDWPNPGDACPCGNDVRVLADDPGPLVEASTGAGAICWIAVACAALAAILAALVLLKHL